MLCYVFLALLLSHSQDMMFILHILSLGEWGINRAFTLLNLLLKALGFSTIVVQQFWRDFNIVSRLRLSKLLRFMPKTTRKFPLTCTQINYFISMVCQYLSVNIGKYFVFFCFLLKQNCISGLLQKHI